MTALVIKDTNGRRALHIGSEDTIKELELRAKRFKIEILEKIEIDVTYSVFGENPYN